MRVVVRAADAVKPGASLVWDACAGNLSADGEVGDKPSTDAAFARAAHIVRLETWINRVTGVPMEPRTAIGDYDSASGRYTIYAGTGGGVVRERQILAAVLERTRGAMPRGVRRHGRQLRHAQQLLSRIRAAALGGAARRTAGEVVRRPHRMLPQRLPGPRSDRHGRARARRGRQFSRLARHQSQQCRRLHRAFHSAAQRASASCRASIAFRRCISAAARC